MPRRDALGGRRDHGFSASRDPQMLRAAVEIEATRTGVETVQIVLTPAAIGHAFPTGDLYRRVVVVARVEGTMIGDVAVLGRSFIDGHRRETDTRLGADGDYTPRVLALSLPGADARAVEWVVAYERADMPGDDGEATLFGSVQLASGRL